MKENNNKNTNGRTGRQMTTQCGNNNNNNSNSDNKKRQCLNAKGACVTVTTKSLDSLCKCAGIWERDWLAGHAHNSNNNRKKHNNNSYNKWAKIAAPRVNRQQAGSQQGSQSNGKGNPSISAC